MEKRRKFKTLHVYLKLITSHVTNFISQTPFTKIENFSIINLQGGVIVWLKLCFILLFNNNLSSLFLFSVMPLVCEKSGAYSN